MGATDQTTFRLEPAKAQGVDTVLDIFARTVQGGLRWERRPWAATPAFVTRPEPAVSAFREYEAAAGTGMWVLTIFDQEFRNTGDRRAVRLTQLDAAGRAVQSLTGLAALDGLAAAVQRTVEGSLAA
jgi:hypothetical protein